MTVLNALLSHANSWKYPFVPRLISYGMHRQPESTDKLFVLKFNLSHKLQLLNVHCATQFLLSDVLHCTNMNTDFVDFRK